MRRSKEPRWTTSSKESSKCSECKETIEKEAKILVVPERKLVLCGDCGSIRAKRYGLKP